MIEIEHILLEHSFIFCIAVNFYFKFFFHSDSLLVWKFWFPFLFFKFRKLPAKKNCLLNYYWNLREFHSQSGVLLWVEKSRILVFYSPRIRANMSYSISKNLIIFNLEKYILEIKQILLVPSTLLVFFLAVHFHLKLIFPTWFHS